ncbi:MAG: DUF2461 domain-containing protein [Planctomycetes bacterium]|nr:DUF2461 domain-containing protein [Planctomycetota bacterium]
MSKAQSTGKFPGFPLGLLHFLNDLSKNNKRDWFQANKLRYETELLEPSLAFIEAMAGPLEKISPHFCAVPKKVGGSLMRIYRDVRFAKDKRPYKTNVGIHFRHELGKDVHAPGFYFHIAPDEVFFGAGIWHPDSKALGKIRKAIDKDPATWKKAQRGKAFRDRFEFGGDSLVRPPKGFDAEHPLIDDLRRKDHIGVFHFDHDALFDPSIVKEASAAFRAAKPLMAFLCQAIGVKF